MSKTSTVTIGVTITGDGVGATDTQTTTNASSPGAIATVIVNTGFTIIAVPTGAIGMTIIPPPNSVVAKTIKGASGDTGIAIHPSNATHLALASGQTSVGVLAPSGETIMVVWS